MYTQLRDRFNWIGKLIGQDEGIKIQKFRVPEIKSHETIF